LYIILYLACDQVGYSSTGVFQ